jgi:hypothetical protein
MLLRVQRTIHDYDDHEQKHNAGRPEKKLERRLGDNGSASFVRFCHGLGTVREAICSGKAGTLKIQ